MNQHSSVRICHHLSLEAPPITLMQQGALGQQQWSGPVPHSE